MFETLIVAVLAVPILAIAGLVISLRNRERLRTLERQLAMLGHAVEDLASGVVPQRSPAEPETKPFTIETPVPDAEAVDEREPKAEPSPAPPEIPIRPFPAAVGPRISLEERLGTQWVVWVGGLALVLGGFFLVRYSIEQGWFGPTQRVFAAAILALALIAAGEWTRRHEVLTGVTGLPAAYIPGILTAAGTTVAFADVYAAYALYNLIGSGPAFLLLGLVALGTLAAALLHGPALAGLGLVGAYVTPLIVSTETPNYWALYLYLAFVTAASFTLARLRLWRWLAIAAVAFSVFWVMPGVDNLAADVLVPHLFHVIVGFALAALLIVSNFIFGPDEERGRIDAISSLALAAYLFGSALIAFANLHELVTLLVYLALVAGAVAIAWRSDAAVGAVPAAALLTALLFLQWSINFDIREYGPPAAPGSWEPEHFIFGTHLWLGAAFAFMFGVAGFLAQTREEAPLPARLWAASAVFAPIAILTALYYRIAEFDRSIPFATAALLLAGAFIFAVDFLDKRERRAGTEAAIAIFAAGAISALALGLTMALEKGWLTVAYALIVAGIAWIADRRPLPGLRWLAAAVTMLVFGRIAWDPLIVGQDVGTTPIFNWLLYGYGIPALSFWYAGTLMRRQKDDIPLRIVEAAAVLFTVLLFFTEIRHYVTGGDPYAPSSELTEVALDVCVGLALAIGLERLRQKTGSIVHNVAAVLLTLLSVLAIVFGLWFLENPALFGEAVGGVFFNLLLLGYALPAVLAGTLALVTRNTRPRWYVVTLAVVAVGLALFYLTLEVIRIYHGPRLSAGPTTDAEQYTISAVWLAFGVVLLAVGIYLRSLPLRAASAAVVMITVLKVFLIDMSDLTGIYRALSFIGLGIVLIGIGWFYQRLLFPRSAPATEEGAP